MQLSPQARGHCLAIARLLLDAVIRLREGNHKGDTEDETENAREVDGEGHTDSQ